MLPRDEQVQFRASVVTMVLHTDMKSHVASVGAMESAVSRHRAAGTWFAPDSPADRKLLLDFALHACDLGNPAKPLRIGLQWADLILREYYQQGDAERQAGLPLSPMMDRNRPTVDAQQCAFIDIVVLPLFSQLHDAFRDESLEPAVRNLADNRAYYASRMSVAKLVPAQAGIIKLRAAERADATAKDEQAKTAAAAEQGDPQVLELDG